MNLKCVQDPVNLNVCKNCQALLKEIEEFLNKWKDILC